MGVGLVGRVSRAGGVEALVCLCLGRGQFTVLDFWFCVAVSLE